jgi:hypothetical protein
MCPVVLELPSPSPLFLLVPPMLCFLWVNLLASDVNLVNIQVLFNVPELILNYFIQNILSSRNL